MGARDRLWLFCAGGKRSELLRILLSVMLKRLLASIAPVSQIKPAEELMIMLNSAKQRQIVAPGIEFDIHHGPSLLGRIDSEEFDA